MITSIASLTIAIAGIPLNYLIGRRVRREQTLDIMSRYRDPLLQATDDLRVRLITILAEDFLGRFLVNGNESQKSAMQSFAPRSRPMSGSQAGSKGWALIFLSWLGVRMSV
jgi:hypothetical protein